MTLQRIEESATEEGADRDNRSATADELPPEAPDTMKLDFDTWEKVLG